MTTEGFIKFDPKGRQLICQGEWNVSNLADIKKEFEKISWGPGDVTIDGNGITQLDIAAGWLLTQGLKKLEKLHFHLKNFSPEQQKLLSLVEKQTVALADIPKIKTPNGLAILGKQVVGQIIEAREFLVFTGKLTFEALRLLRHPRHLRWGSFASTIQITGYQALPIIALLSFMIGVVISYQMGNQLRNYGANVFIVDLLGLSVLREFGPLITAIMVAGRTGSAFTAQLGIMKLNQEIDALDTMGITPAELIILPRLAGLFIALPLLTMWADIFGVFGGMMMANNMLDISAYNFLIRFQHAIPLRALIIGLGKAPVFALLIGSIGCFQGSQVGGSAESVGQRTTRSVVLAIFFIIITDAIFSVIFSKLKL